MSTSDAIRITVHELLDEPGPAWEADLIKRYREVATRMTALHVEHYKARDKNWFWGKRDSYVKIPTDLTNKYRPRQFEELCTFADAGLIVPDLDLATDDAKRDYQSARMAFIDHVTEKLASAFAHDAALRISGTITFRELITGVLTVKQVVESPLPAEPPFRTIISTRARLDISIQVKTNYRYGRNSANRQITQYHQYPIIVRLVEVDNKPIAANSIEQAAFAISGRNPTSEAAAARKARVDAKTAYRKQLVDLERRKRVIDDRCTSLRYFVEGVKYHKGNETRIGEILAKAGFPTAAELTAAHKVASGELKMIRAEIKLAKANKP